MADPSAMEWCLVNLRLRLERALRDTKYIPDTDKSGHPHGYSVVQIPDWEARQLVDTINEAIGVDKAREGAKGE